MAVGAVYYVVQATASDGDLLDLDNIELSQSSLVVATDPDTGAQVEYATLRSSNSHRVWADLEQIPTNLQYAFICTEDKDFYSEPGVNFKRTIGAMINEYLLPIYSSKQGASTLEQQLIKNLTSDKSASGIEGALRKLRRGFGTRMDKFESRMDGFESRMDRMEERQKRFEEETRNNFADIKLHLENITDRNISILAENHLNLINKMDVSATWMNRIMINEVRMNALTDQVARLQVKSS